MTPEDPMPNSPSLITDLVTLVRIGFLVTVAGRRAIASDVHGTAGTILMGILQAEDTEQALAALATTSPLDVEALNGAYRERNAVVAALIRSNGWPAEVVMAPDTEGWWIVYAETPTGQVSWHIAPEDMDLFRDWPVAFGSHRSPWDGHTTEEKYARLVRLGSTIMTRLLTLLAAIVLSPFALVAWLWIVKPWEEWHR
jgi:hypothetical protein